jgi:hypothetical protein
MAGGRCVHRPPILQLRVGWVNPATGERLIVTDPAGEILPDGFAVLPLEI